MSNPRLAELDDAIHADMLDAGLADTGVYEFGGLPSGVACRVLIDRAVQVYGFDSEVATPVATVRVWTDDLGTTPRRGDVVIVGEDRFVIDRIIERDETTCTCTVTTDVCA